MLSSRAWCGYEAWRVGDRKWKLLEASFLSNLSGKLAPAFAENGLSMLDDGQYADENPADARWTRLPEGYNEIVMDLGGLHGVDEVFMRVLNCHKADIEPPVKAYLWASEDGKSYHLAGIQDVSSSPNNLHDAWVDALLFSVSDVHARWLKIALSGSTQVLVDEVVVNPVM